MKITKKISELLVERGLITQPQLDEALAEQKKTNKRLEHILVESGFIKEKDFANLLALQMGLPYVELNNYIIDPSIVNIIPEKIAKQHKMLPIFKIKDILTIAVVDPFDLVGIDAVKAVSKCLLQLVICAESDILQAIEQYYTVSDSIDGIIQHLEKTGLSFLKEERFDLIRLQRIAEEPPVIKLVNLIISQALKDKASDIHIEPREDKIIIRMRIDGMLHDVLSLPGHINIPVIPRIKVISGLDIIERRKSQDGRFRVRIENREVDMRISTFPVAFGEKVVIRILYRETALLDMENLGFPEGALKRFEEIIKKPNGIILVTGPTGSGKTSTLYAALNRLNSPEKNIVTLENPREYLLKGINQGEVNPEVGLSFSEGLKAILRQDPDIIMVGEIRDHETAEIAIRAALTGHLVLSTLHTNDAPGAITRLIDMGIEPFLISSSLLAVVAQRLVRVICRDCKQPYEAPLDLLKNIPSRFSLDGVILSHGKGCTLCKHTGYKGRIGIFEMMIIDAKIKALIASRSTTDSIRSIAIKAGMNSLREDGIQKVIKGITTMEEMFRVTQG